MPASDLLIPHALGAEEARKRIAAFAQSVELHPGWARNIQSSWNDNRGQFSLTIFGMTVSGSVETRADAVQIRVEYPLAARPFKSRIERDILSKGRQLLARDNPAGA